MAHRYDTRASRPEGALPLQATYAAAESAKKAAAAAVSAELRAVASQNDDDLAPTPSAVRVAARERLARSEPRVVSSQRFNNRPAAADIQHLRNEWKRQQPAQHLGQGDAVAIAEGGQPPANRNSAVPMPASDQATAEQQIVVYEHRGIRIELLVGDIACQATEAIVNAAHPSLVGGRGVTGALVEAAGPKFRSECAEFVRRHGRIANTECGITGAGQLPAYFVVHVVSFRATTGTNDDKTSDAMLTTYLNLFSAIGELDVSSVAVPVIGADSYYGVPLEVTAEAAVTAVLLVAEEAGQTHSELRLVRFVLPDAAHVSAYKQAFDDAGLRACKDTMKPTSPAPQSRQSTIPGVGARGIREDDMDSCVSHVSDWAEASTNSLIRGDVTDASIRTRGRPMKIAALSEKEKTHLHTRPRNSPDSPSRWPIDKGAKIQDGINSVSAVNSKFEFKPRPYNGNGWVDQYLTQFKYGAESAKWPREEWGLRLITALEGKALRVITESRLPPDQKPSFEIVAKLLRDTFASDASRDVWLTTLEHRRRYQNESLTELSQAITELVSKAFPGTDVEERHRIAVGYFARATGSSLRQHTLASRPKSLAEALQTALAFENACRLDDLDEKRVKTVDRSSKIRTMGAGPEGDDQSNESSAVYVTQSNSDVRHDRQAAADRQTPRPAGRIIWQFCGKNGHGAKDCWAGNRAAPYGRQENQSHWPTRTEQEAGDRVHRLERELMLMNEQVRQLTTDRQPAKAAIAHGVGAPAQSELPPRLPGSCYNCGATDHWANACPQPRNQGRGRGRGRGRWGNGSGRGGSERPLGYGQQ